ncbi:MAG: T9SS type A sorting domain-containing protein [Candidatus Eisenbacteria bacterium]|nr:T9SS type A sorting domain-containing protein [Candidatus Eisenbacteria bacterium]
MIFEIASTMEMLESFQETYGMRFVGLEDPMGTTYSDYRVPDPEAPYPQDIIIDQNGIVRYWSWEYDPQTLIAVIDGLLETSSADDSGGSLGETRVEFPVPNPFAGSTALRYRLQRPSQVQVRVIDSAGRIVRTLLRAHQSRGRHSVVWDGRDEQHRSAANGVYFFIVSTDTRNLSRRMVLLR